MTEAEDTEEFGGDSLLESCERLYDLAWNGNVEDVFALRPVLRDPKETRISVKTPETITVLTWKSNAGGDPWLLNYFYVKSVYVRDEFQDMLSDILRKCKVDDGVDIVIDPDPVFGIRNPFHQELPVMANLDASVTGSSGIGKSMFLLYVLVLRTLAGKPTAIMLHDRGVLVITSSKVRYVQLDFFNRARLPNGSWFLVDCRGNLRSVPDFIIRAATLCGGFIVQAASQRSDNQAWLTNTGLGIPPRLYMKSWTLEELISARYLQKKPFIPTEDAIRTFVERYGSAPRYVYGNAHQLKLYSILIRDKMAAFDYKNLKDAVFGSTRDYSSFDPTISHMIIHVTPSDTDREEYSRGVPTRYLTEILYEHFTKRHQRATRELYELFVANAFTKASAGFLLERLFVEEFPSGGEWLMTEMQPSDERTRTHWDYSRDAPKVFLRLGYQGKLLEISNRQAPKNATFFSLPTTRFERHKKMSLSQTFFIPACRTHPSFDAFIYNTSTKTATLFQVTVGKQHDVKEGGLSWLIQSGARYLDIIIVTCPMKGEKGGLEKLVIDMKIKSMLRNAYHLILQDRQDDFDEETETGSSGTEALKDDDIDSESLTQMSDSD